MFTFTASLSGGKIKKNWKLVYQHSQFVAALFAKLVHIKTTFCGYVITDNFINTFDLSLT